MKIRVADRYDLDQLITLMHHYADESPITELRSNRDVNYVRRLFTQILVGGGVAFVAEHKDEIVGMLLAIRTGNIWNPQVWTLQEICWWVEQEHRHTTAGYKLAKAYEKYAREQMKSNKITYWTLSKMAVSPDMDYTRFGLNKLEETHLCQQV